MPYAKHVHSKLICPVTKQPMNEHNPPMMTPSGHVFSELAIQQLTVAHDGKVKCPVSGGEFVQCHFT